jgi:hypothetical protein
MGLFGNFKSSRFNEGNPLFARRAAKKRAQEEAALKVQQEESNKKTGWIDITDHKEIEDITNDPEQ